MNLHGDKDYSIILFCINYLSKNNRLVNTFDLFLELESRYPLGLSEFQLRQYLKKLCENGYIYFYDDSNIILRHI